MKPNSAPGIDGFTVAWVRTFWSSLEDFCYQTVNECNERGRLNCTLRVAIMKLLRKGEKIHLKPETTAPSHSSASFTRLQVESSPEDSKLSSKRL